MAREGGAAVHEGPDVDLHGLRSFRDQVAEATTERDTPNQLEPWLLQVDAHHPARWSIPSTSSWNRACRARLISLPGSRAAHLEHTANPSTLASLPSMLNSTSAASTSSTGHALVGLSLPPFPVVLRPLGLRPSLAGAGVVLGVDLELV